MNKTKTSTKSPESFPIDPVFGHHICDEGASEGGMATNSAYTYPLPPAHWMTHPQIFHIWIARDVENELIQTARYRSPTRVCSCS